jgi:hypothetical protein
MPIPRGPGMTDPCRAGRIDKVDRGPMDPDRGSILTGPSPILIIARGARCRAN